MTALIILHSLVFAERAQVRAFGFTEDMQALSAYRLLCIASACRDKRLLRDVRKIAVLLHTTVQVYASDSVFSVQRIGKAYAAVFLCVLTSGIEVRPRFGVIAFRKLARMGVDKEFIQSTRIVILAGTHHHPIRLVPHFFGYVSAKLRFHLFKLRLCFLARRTVNALVVLVRLALDCSDKLLRRQIFLFVPVFQVRGKIFGNTQT